MPKIRLFSLGIVFAMLSACSQNQSVERKNYNSWEKDYGYSQVVKVGDTLYLSGLASNKPNLAGQIEEIYATILNILKDYGLDSDAIVKQVIYAIDIEAVKSKTELRKSFFKDNKYPSSTIVQIDRLYEEEHLIEVEIVAVIY